MVTSWSSVSAGVGAHTPSPNPPNNNAQQPPPDDAHSRPILSLSPHTSPTHSLLLFSPNDNHTADTTAMVPGGPDNPLDPRFRQGVRLPPPPPGRPPPSPPPPSTPPPSTLTYLLAECSVGYTLSKEIMEPITGRQGKKYDHDETMWYWSVEPAARGTALTRHHSAPNPFVCANCTFSRINCRIRAFQVAEKGGYFALGDCRSCHHKSGQCPAGSGATGKYFVFLDKDTIMIVNKHTKEEVSRVSSTQTLHDSAHRIAHA